MERKIKYISICLLIWASGYGQKLIEFQDRDTKQYGLRDTDGNVVTPAKYGYIGDFSEGMAKVRNNYKYGFINEAGEEIVSPKYTTVHDFSEDLAGVKLVSQGKDKYGQTEIRINSGFIDKTGKEVIPLTYYEVNSFSEGLASVKKDRVGWGYIDKTGKIIIPFNFKYEEAGDFSEGMAVVGDKAKRGYIDKTGKEVVPFKYAEANVFSEGLACVKLHTLEDNYGFIDKDGNEVIPLKYESAKNFSGNLAEVELFGRKHYIDKTGELEKTCKNLIMHYVKEIDDYRMKINKSYNSNSFIINHPYIVLSANNGIDNEEIIFIKYSDGDFTTTSIDDLKTIIIEYPFLFQSVPYYHKSESLTIRNYGSYLIYFDLEKKECIGYDVIPGRKLEKEIGVTLKKPKLYRRVYSYSIFDNIKLHLEDSEDETDDW